MEEDVTAFKRKDTFLENQDVKGGPTDFVNQNLSI